MAIKERTDAAALKRLLEDAGYTPRSYSGRGMYGRRCIAIDQRQDEPLRREGYVYEDLMDVVEGDTDGTRLFKQAIRNSQVDSMGIGIVVYFPSFDWDDAWTERAMVCSTP